jgi:hypothetical protein
MIDGKRGPAFSHERISTLKEISIYSDNEDVPLEDVFKKIYELQDGKAVFDPIKLLQTRSRNCSKKYCLTMIGKLFMFLT